MDRASVPNALEITLEAACDISLECWRLTRAAASAKEGSDIAAVRYSARRITEVLRTLGLATTDLTGRRYDAGLAPEVLNVVLDDTVPEGQFFIEETISPTVTWFGLIIKPGQIIVKRSSLENERKTG